MFSINLFLIFPLLHHCKATEDLNTKIKSETQRIFAGHIVRLSPKTILKIDPKNSFGTKCVESYNVLNVLNNFLIFLITSIFGGEHFFRGQFLIEIFAYCQ